MEDVGQEVLAVFMREPQYIRGTDTYSQVDRYLPEEWDRDAILESLPKALPSLQGHSTYCEEVDDVLENWAQTLLTSRETTLNSVYCLLDFTYYRVLDYTLLDRYLEILQSKSPSKIQMLYHTVRRRLAALEGKKNVSPEQISKVDGEVEMLREHAVDEAVESFRLALDYGLVGGVSFHSNVFKNNKDWTFNLRPRRKHQVLRTQDLPAFDSLAMKFDDILKQSKVPPKKRRDMIEDLFVHFYREWYDTRTKPRRIEKRLYRLQKK